MQFAQRRGQIAQSFARLPVGTPGRSYASQMHLISRRSRTSGPVSTKTLSPLALAVAAAIALGGVGLSAAAPAVAAPIQTESPGPSPDGPGETELSTPVVLDVETTTVLNIINAPTSYGGFAILSAIVEPTGPAILIGQSVEFESDGVSLGSSPLLYVGGGKFISLLPVAYVPDAGTHSIIARFAGAYDEATGSNALPSVSAPYEMIVAPATTETWITAAPSTVLAFEQVDISARVSSPVPGAKGWVALFADESPVAYADLSEDGSANFVGVSLPWGTTALRAKFLGGETRNFTESTSVAQRVSVTALGTAVTLEVPPSTLRADDTLTFRGTVTNTGEGGRVDPRGEIQILVDGTVQYSAVLGASADSTEGDGAAQFAIEAGELSLGEHSVQARFLPSPGFSGAESGEFDFRILGVETEITPAEETVRVASGMSVPLSVTVAALGAGDRPDAPVDGYVQAFIDNQPYGEALTVENGVGRAELPALAVGEHEVELRFTPAEHGRLKSSATVAVIVAAEDDGGTDGGTDDSDGASPEPKHPDASGKSEQTAVLGATGSETPLILLGGLGALLLGAGAILGGRRLRLRRR